MENETLLTVTEAAERIGVSESAIRNATLESRLPFRRLYGRKLILDADLMKYRDRTQPKGVKPKGRPKRVAASAEAPAQETATGTPA